MINLNAAFEDELYFDYLKDPESVSKEWREYFEKTHGKSIVPLHISENRYQDRSDSSQKDESSDFDKC